MFFIFFPPHFFKNNFSHPTNGTFGFAQLTKPTLRKTKRAIFCHRTNDDFGYIKTIFTDTETDYKLIEQDKNNGNKKI
jgi:hypothetical protein